MSTSLPPQERRKITARSLGQKKTKAQPITMLTAYDYATARVIDRAGVDGILVGDSLGMVVLGYETTLPVTMDDMLHHCKAVARGARSALLVGDMPFMSYQACVDEAVRNAGRFLQEAGMDAVKLEGGGQRVKTVEAIVSAGIPVMGHLGLTPQSVRQFGGFRAQGKTTREAVRLFEDAQALQEVGCFALVLESIPARLARWVSGRLEVPTIGIGAGPGCDGQVLVTHDVLGLLDGVAPRFVRKYADLHAEMARAFASYIAEVESGAFPCEEHTVDMSEEEWQGFLQAVA